MFLYHVDLVNYMDKVTDKIRIPNKDDFDGAMAGLLRVQSTYSISADNVIPSCLKKVIGSFAA